LQHSIAFRVTESAWRTLQSTAKKQNISVAQLASSHRSDDVTRHLRADAPKTRGVLAFTHLRPCARTAVRRRQRRANSSAGTGLTSPPFHITRQPIGFLMRRNSRSIGTRRTRRVQAVSACYSGGSKYPARRDDRRHWTSSLPAGHVYRSLSGSKVKSALGAGSRAWRADYAGVDPTPRGFVGKRREWPGHYWTRKSCSAHERDGRLGVGTFDRRMVFSVHARFPDAGLKAD
jgi:hypothetical protein